MVPPRISLVTLGAYDLPALRRFYEALGWPAAEGSDDSFTRFDLGGAFLALYGAKDLAGEANKPTPAPTDGFRGFTLCLNVETAEMVDAAFEDARRAGARVLAEPVARDWGGRSAYFADPEGNAWEIAWVPGAKFDARGALIWPP